jgi:hypothetical protein
MKSGGLSDKEAKLIAAARREVAAKRSGGTPPPAKSAGPTARRGGGAPPPAARPGPTAPLDGRTVVGWDHPAAAPRPAAGNADAKWARIASLMESERAAANAKRQRLKRRVTILLSVVLVVAALMAARAMLGR